MSNEARYHIGTPGTKWGDAEKKEWLAEQTVRREYSDEVLTKLDVIRKHFDVEQYGALPISSDRYPLFAAKSRNWRSSKPAIQATVFVALVASDAGDTELAAKGRHLLAFEQSGYET
jgi:hypothetical protein